LAPLSSAYQSSQNDSFSKSSPQIAEFFEKNAILSEMPLDVPYVTTYNRHTDTGAKQMPKRFRVQSQTFSTLEDAIACAGRIYRRTGNVVAITEVKGRK
jgi:hypothetical protein